MSPIRSSARSRATPLTRLAIALLAAQLAGCMAYSRGEFDIDRTPIMNTGARATILYPGQGPLPMPGSAPPRAATAPGASHPSASSTSRGAPDPNHGAAPQTTAPAPSGAAGAPPSDPDAGMTYLGGTRQDEQRHLDVRQEPLAIKYLTAPLALIAAPFVLAKEALQGEPEPGPPVPRAIPPGTTPSTAPGAAPQSLRPDYETAMLQNLERELEQRQSAERSRTARTGSAPAPHATRRATGGAPSIAEELEALQRVPELPRAHGEASESAAAVPPRSAGRAPNSDPHATAHGIIDRNDDGQIDHWIYRVNGEIARQVFDEDFDGRADRTVFFDLQTHQVSRVEEDSNGDGIVDSWIDYRDGAIVRRRSDSDGDRRVDTWSFYRSGELARHEQDTTHDGYRDATSFYQDGRLVREERDENGDGLPDVTLYYDTSERMVRREEDRDANGVIDVISHYRGGRLVRRELLDNEELAAGEPNARLDERAR